MKADVEAGHPVETQGWSHYEGAGGVRAMACHETGLVLLTDGEGGQVVLPGGGDDLQQLLHTWLTESNLAREFDLSSA